MDNLQRVALFPIPDCVVFPGTVFPLHVFEPRYREMIKHCIKEKLPLAICHTEKTLHEAAPAKSKEEALRSNQDTYKPVSVFGAGRCELVSTTDDGRLLVNVYVDRRLKLIEEEQTLPFIIAKCEPLLDYIINPNDIDLANELKDKISHRLIALSGRDESITNKLESDEWQSKSAQSFSFELFSVVRMESEIQQRILEERNALNRLKITLNILNGES